MAGIYCATSLIFSLVAFSAFGVHDGLPRYFSVHDAIVVVKAVLVGELMTCVVLFTLTHLDGIPRSTPAIHALTLCAGLVTVRALGRITAKSRKPADPGSHPSGQHIIMIGLNDLSSLYMKCLEALAAHQHRVIAVLDERPGSFGRTINGVRVMGSSAQLEPLIEEFAVHGVRTDRVVVGGGVDILTDDALKEIQHVCARRDVDLEFVPRLLGLDEATANVESAPCVVRAASRGDSASSSTVASYFRFRRFADFIIALVLLTALLPLWALVASLAFLDVGFPLLFWQQRVGLNGCTFLTYKISNASTAVRLARRKGAGGTAAVLDRAVPAPNAPRRVAAIVERTRRRHVLDRAAPPPSARPTTDSDSAAVGATRHHGLGPGQWWQARFARGKGGAG